MPPPNFADSFEDSSERRSWAAQTLDFVERLGNRLPDPVVLFVIALIFSWGASWYLSTVSFADIDPRTKEPIRIHNQLTGTALAQFLSNMVETFVKFPPLGMVLVSLLGVGVAQQTGFVDAILKALLSVTPHRFLTPMVLFVSVLSHTAGDSSYVLIVPLGGVIFYTAGRHPLAGIAAAFAGVAGGFSANIIPSSLDPLLQGFTQSAAQIIDPTRTVNPLCNWWFTGASGFFLVFIGWYLTDFVVEPRLKGTPLDGDPKDMPPLTPLSADERNGMLAGLASGAAAAAFFALAAWPLDSPLRSETHELTSATAPLMKSVVPLIFILFLVPGIVHGYVSGTVRTHHDVIRAMTQSMSTMGYYLVLAFFAAQFTAVFRDSNVGALIAIKGALFLKSLSMPSGITIVGIIILSALVDVLVGSASAKWALMAMIFVPMLMQVGISPELTQAAYRIGDSTTNVITPLMPYFPLVVVYCQRYVKSTGIGTLVAVMLPYSLVFLACWTLFLLAFWGMGIPLGINATYTYPP